MKIILKNGKEIKVSKEEANFLANLLMKCDSDSNANIRLTKKRLFRKEKTFRLFVASSDISAIV